MNIYSYGTCLLIEFNFLKKVCFFNAFLTFLYSFKIEVLHVQDFKEFHSMGVYIENPTVLTPHPCHLPETTTFHWLFEKVLQKLFRMFFKKQFLVFKNN